MRPSLSSSFAKIVLCTLIAILAVSSAFAQLPGAIFTTDNTGTQVNGNIYTSKSAVYLDGGPQPNAPCSAAGLPDGNYYFQVTDPSGSVDLSTPAPSSDAISSREVTVSGGLITAYIGIPATHATGTGKCPGSISVGLAPFNDTPNPGGEYKAWMTPVADWVGPTGTCPTGANHFGFCDSTSKTDNFKVKPAGSTVADVIVCKFNDLNDNGLLDSGEPFIPGWPITATGVDSVSGTRDTTVTTQTDATGCVSFSISDIASGTKRTVTLTEGTLGVDWKQTAPGNGIYDSSGNSATTGPTTVSGALPSTGLPASGGVISVTLNPGDTVTAPNFGNTNPNCATATACGGTILVVSKNASPSNKFTWTVAKSVDKTEIDDSTGSATFNYTVTVTHDTGTGWVATGNITVSNPTPADITATVTDAVDNGGNCIITDTAGGVGELIEAGEQIIVPYTCTYSALPALGTNTATASWDSSFASGTAPVDFTNAVIDGSVSVSDPLDTSSPRAFDYTASSPITYTYSHTYTGDPAGTCTPHNNTATLTTNTTGTVLPSSQTVKQCVGKDLTVVKTATPSFNSSITKSVDKTKVEQSGGNITFNYTVTVTESGWQVAGTITVTNPNDWEPITVNVTDLIDGGGSCTVTGGTGVVIAASSSSAPLSYTCTYGTKPTLVSGTNTAYAGVTSGIVPDTNVSGTKGYTFATLTVTDNVQDSANPTGCAATLGTVSVIATTPSGSPGCGVTGLTSPSWGVFKYSITDANAPPATCNSYNNTAAITGGSSSTQVTVTVCNTATGAATMGFWQNKNGQAIITGGLSTGGVCNSATFLRTYAPFQDLSATATCAQVATYVSNIIKAANASGASMNAMLKAQMLSTALDVYFSGGGGGNPLKAPVSLGGVKIDLTQVCIMIDSTGGTASCSGKTEDCTSAFGGATCPTVSQLLTFAASQSNVGGSTWYAQNKTTQGLAKNTFDAINNQAAYICP